MLRGELGEVGFASGVEVEFPGVAAQGMVKKRQMALGRRYVVLELGGVLVAVGLVADSGAVGRRPRVCVVGNGEVICFCWRRRAG